MTRASDTWVVVGGGVSGIASAHYLHQRGLKPVVLERSAELGGRIGSCQLGERRVDFGGKNIGRRYTAFRRFTAELGEHPYEFFGINSSQVRSGKIVTFDDARRYRGMLELAKGARLTDLARLGRILLHVRRDEENGYLGSELSARLGERLDKRPVASYFSKEFCRRIMRPMSVRMNGAEPDEIYPGNLGSNVRMVLDTFDQLARGMAPLLRDFQARVDVRVNCSVESLLFHKGRPVAVQVSGPGGVAEEIACAGVILAVPAPCAAALLRPLAPELAHRLRDVSYYPVSLVLAEYDRPIFSADVRALVFDESEPLSNAGAYGVHALDLVRYTFSGRVARSLDHYDDEGLLSAGERVLRQVIPVEESWRRRYVVRRFHQGLCAYTPFHGRFLQDLNRELDQLPGLGLAGDYLAGASIEACFRAAATAVARVAAAAGEPRRQGDGFPSSRLTDSQP